jgi:LacI family transcriptional regulator
VPADVSVVSFDDPIASWVRPRLTTLALPHYELGRRAVDVVFGDDDRPMAREEANIYRIGMPLRERDSVRTPDPGG